MQPNGDKDHPIIGRTELKYKQDKNRKNEKINILFLLLIATLTYSCNETIKTNPGTVTDTANEQKKSSPCLIPSTELLQKQTLQSTLIFIPKMPFLRVPMLQNVGIKKLL